MRRFVHASADWAKPMPWRIRMWHRTWTLNAAIRRLRADPEGCLAPGRTVLEACSYGWGNESWSASIDFLRASMQHVLHARGAIIECGSGLSTLVIGVVAASRGLEHLALESSPEWAVKVRHSLHRLRIPSRVMNAPLRDFGGYSWYSVQSEDMPQEIALVICDGPPGTTPGGRYGLGPRLGSRLAKGAVILLDDANRDAEREVAERWVRELGLRYEVSAGPKPFAKLTAV